MARTSGIDLKQIGGERTALLVGLHDGRVTRLMLYLDRDRAPRRRWPGAGGRDDELRRSHRGTRSSGLIKMVAHPQGRQGFRTALGLLRATASRLTQQ